MSQTYLVKASHPYLGIRYLRELRTSGWLTWGPRDVAHQFPSQALAEAAGHTVQQLRPAWSVAVEPLPEKPLGGSLPSA